MIAALEDILRRPRVVLTLMLVLIIAGIGSYISLPKEARPNIEVPVYYVAIPYQGISPEDAERLLVKPMEEKLRGLDGIKEITGIASQSFAAIVIEFEPEIDTRKASRDVREKVDLAKADLPADAEDPVVSEVNLNLFPTILVALSGDVPERTLFAHAKKLQEQIEAIPTVLEANLNGQREELLEVNIDELKLEAYKVSQLELINAITRNNRLVAAGAIDAGKGRFNVKVPGLFATAKDVYSVPIKVNGDAVVTLGDIADIRRTFKDSTSYARINGRPAITISVVKRIGENIVTTNEEVRRVVSNASKNWPERIHVNFALDESQMIFEVLGSLQSSILTAIALVMVICVAALGIRSALMVGLAIPTSFMLGFLIVSLMGNSINNMLMFGMVLTVGMLVDGAIVITEYADRKMAEGIHRREAYIMAAKRMFWPVTSSTATTLAAFLPMLFWPGVTGKFMSNLPVTVIIVLSASLITAMVFLPVIGSFFGKVDRSSNASIKQLSGAKTGDLRELGGFTGFYVRLLSGMIKVPLLVTVIAVGLIVAVFMSFGSHSNGVTFFVDTEADQAIVYVRSRGNISIDEKLRLTKKVESILLDVKGIETVSTSVGGGGAGGPKIGTGGGLDKPKDVIGQMTIELSDFKNRRRGAVILKEARKRTASLPGVIVEIKKREDGPPSGKDIRLQVRANDSATANTAARKIRDHFEKEVTGLVDITDETPLPGIEWTLSVNRTEAGRYGTDISSVGAIIQLVTNGILVGTYRPDDSTDEVDIRVRLPRQERSLERIQNMRIRTPNGMVPLSNFVTRKVQPAVDSIIRKDGFVSVYVKANAAEGIDPDIKIAEVDAWLKKQTWPEDVKFRFRGGDENKKKSQDFLTKAMLASIFLMFIILVTQFNSFYHAFLTLSTLVMSVAGVLIGMMVTGQAFSVIMTGTGIIALAGIVVNNAIVLIDTYHVLLGEGMPVREAVLRTAAQRLRPVMLTTVTTIFGLLPMIFEINLGWFAGSVQLGSLTSNWWVQLATAISFGLAFATLLTLFLTPVLLAAPTVWKDAIMGVVNWFKKKPAQTEPAGEPAENDNSQKKSPTLSQAAE
jgi:multidrug efflux pump